LRRNIDKNSIELISKCAKTRLHQCRILKKLTSRISASRGRRACNGSENGRERSREAGRWKANGIAYPLISA